MSEELPPGLRRMLDDLPVGQPPLEDVLAARTRVHRRRRVAIVGAVAAVAAVAGVGFVAAQVVGGGEGTKGTAIAAPSGSTTPPTPLRGTVRDVPTNDWHPGDGANEALISGTLVINPRGCLVLQSSGEVPTHVLWPAGYTALVDTDGRTHLRDPSGTVVASVGDAISAGGGYGGRRSTDPCLKGKGPVASVQSEVLVTEKAPAQPMPDLPEPTGSADDAAYQKWVQREPLPDCGEQWLPIMLSMGDNQDLAYAECLRAAAKGGTGGEAVVHFSTVEGDPITEYLRVFPQGQVEVFTDATLDKFGSQRWHRSTCANVDAALDQDC